MQKPLPDRLADGAVLVGDGAMGTMLLKGGLQSGAPPESINLSRIRQLAKAREFAMNQANITAGRIVDILE